MAQTDLRAGLHIGLVQLTGGNGLPMPDLLGFGPIHLRLAIKEACHGRNAGKLGVELGQSGFKMRFDQRLGLCHAGPSLCIQADEV